MSNTLYGANYYVKINGTNTSYGTNWQTAWKTIGYAASNVGAGSVVTVSNGIYNEQVTIQSNGTAVNYIIFKALNQGQAIVNASGKLCGFYLNGKSYIRIEGFKITKATNYGIYVNNINNYIVKNIIYSNEGHGIRISGDNHFILTNHIYRNDNHGIGISGNNNIIMSNQIHNHIFHSMWIDDGASSNIINKNIMYSNIYGITIQSTNSTYNHISSNYIFGLNQYYGIIINNTKHNYIYCNEIYQSTNGILVQSSAKSNYIHHNNIYSNFKNGIWVVQSTNNKIYRNIIYNNEQNGIKIHELSSDIEIINNTIFGSISSNGVVWNDNSSGVMYNNIILSNGNGAGDYGIANLSTGSVHVAYNDIYGNFAGPTNGPLIWGSGNISNNPMIDTVSSFEIQSVFSPCIDTGTNIQGITDGYLGTAPDMGWKESSSDRISPAIFPDKSPGQYIGDLDLKLTAYKDSTKQEVDASALIMVTIFRNDLAYQSHAGNGNVNMILPVGAKYTLKFYAIDEMDNTSQTNEAEYIVLRKSQKEIAVYPTVVNLHQEDKMTFIFNELKNNVDIKIYTLRGDEVKSIKGVDFSSGCYEYNTKDLHFLPTGQYIVRIENKRTLFFLIK